MKPYYTDDAVTIYHGDAREVLRDLRGFDAVITDPPYSSGGWTRSDRNLKTSEKYRMTTAAKVDPDFSGDNRDQRSFTLWCSDWMASALAACRPGAALLCFIDWRNLPCVIDAAQVGGWVYRGIVVWDKTESQRPQKGWFRAQVEYLVLGSSGPLARDAEVDGKCQPGVFRHRVIGADKQHLTEKPAGLLREILSTREEWQTVLDPFMGSGTMLRAAKDLGRRAVGIEMEERYCEIAAKRMSQAALDLGGI